MVKIKIISKLSVRETRIHHVSNQKALLTAIKMYDPFQNR